MPLKQKYMFIVPINVLFTNFSFPLDNALSIGSKHHSIASFYINVELDYYKHL